jgi:hypothetical protein
VELEEQGSEAELRAFFESENVFWGLFGFSYRRLYASLGNNWYGSRQAQPTKRNSHSLTATIAFTFQIIRVEIMGSRSRITTPDDRTSDARDESKTLPSSVDQPDRVETAS